MLSILAGEASTCQCTCSGNGAAGVGGGFGEAESRHYPAGDPRCKDLKGGFYV